MKITVEVSPEDLAVITQEVMKASGPEAMSRIWMMVADKVAEQMNAQMMTQIQEGFLPFFNVKPRQTPSHES
jgi:hypothetical protein